MYHFFSSDIFRNVDKSKIESNTDCMKWYERAKKIMKSKGITQESLIGVLGVETRGAVGHYLTGRREPSPNQIINLANALGCSIDELMGNIDQDHALVLKALRGAKKAMAESGQQFNDDERRQIYRAVADCALEKSANDEKITQFIEKMTTL